MNAPMNMVAEYARIADVVYGIFLDGTRGFDLLRKDIDHTQQFAISKMPEMTVEELDKAEMIYGRGDPNTSASRTLHYCTQAEYKRRNERGGQNVRMLSNLCLVLIYQYWEDNYRSKIADQMGIPKNSLNADVMGDLRIMRHSILHHQGVALPEISGCRLLKWFKEGDEIIVTENQFEEIIKHLGAFLRSLTPLPSKL